MPILLPDLDLVWVFAFDLGKLCNPEDVGTRLLQSGIASRMLRFDVRGKPSFVPPREEKKEKVVAYGFDQKGPRVVASDRISPEVTDILDLMGRKDMVLFYDEYRRTNRYVRLELQGFEASFPELPEKIPDLVQVEVYLTIHRTGFAVLSFWFLVRGSSLGFSDLVYLEKDNRAMRARIWRGLVEQHAKVSSSARDFLKQVDKESLQHITGMTNVGSLRNIYACYIQTKGVLGDVYSIEELEKKLRYQPISAHPVAALRNVGGSDLRKFIEQHKSEVHGVLTKEEYWNWVSSEWINKALRRNLAWRSDWAVYIGNGASLLLLAPSVKERVADILKSIGSGEMEKNLELQYRAMDLDLIEVIEILCLQEIVLRAYDNMLSLQSTASIQSLAALRQLIAEGLDEYYNIRVWPHATAREWVRSGQEAMNIEQTYRSVKDKLELLEGKLRIHYETRLNELIIMLTVVFGLVGLIQFLVLLEAPLWVLFLSIVALLSGFLLLARKWRIV